MATLDAANSVAAACWIGCPLGYLVHYSATATCSRHGAELTSCSYLQVLEAAGAGECPACGRRGFAGLAGVRRHMAHRANPACRAHSTHAEVRGGA